MSQIDDLIQRLCPNGVEFAQLAEIFEIRNGYTPARGDVRNWDAATVPWFRMDDIRTNGRILSDSIEHVSPLGVKGGRLFPAYSLIVATSATIGEHALIRVPFLANQRFTCLSLRAGYTDRVDMMFAYYYCFRLDEWCRSNTSTSSFASVDMAGFRRFQFPLPPLDVQREIVHVLDLFQSLEAELEAELEARRRQFAHYRDQLITQSVSHEREWVSLGDLGEIFRGRRFVKDDYVEDGLAAIHYGQIYTHYGTKADAVLTRVRADLRPSLRFAQRGDLVIAEVGETVEDVAKSVAWLGDEDVAVHDGCFVLRHQQNPTYLSYCMQIAALRAQKAQFVARAKVNRLSFDGVKQLRVPVPPPTEQARIVEMLDKFDELVNDLSSGLPAELAARRTQYEYYRNKLLTFEAAA